MANAQDISRIKANVAKMLGQGAPEADVNSYLNTEGVTADQIRNSPVAAPGQITGATPEVKAYDPSLTQRISDLVTSWRTGAPPPQLPDNAGMALKAVDATQTGGAAIDTMARGMTGGLYDEAAGLGQGTGAALSGQSFTPAFQQGMNATNQNIDRFKTDNPVTGSLLEGAGMAASPLFRLGQDWQQAGKTVASRAFKGGLLGAGYGGASAAAYNQGGLADRADAAAFGAGLGGPIGFLLPPLIEGATKGGQGFYNTFQARKAAANDPSGQARALLAKAIGRDQFTPLPTDGESLATAGGPNVQALARQSTVAPGNARAVAENFYEGAAADRPDIIGQAVKQNIHGNNYLATLDQLTKQQQTVASPLYEQAYKANQSMASPELDNILATPAGKQALTKAATMMLNDRSRIGIPDPELTAIVKELSDRGTMDPVKGGVAAGLKLRGLDYVKRALDSQYETLRASGQKTEAGIILGLKKDLVSELDRLDTTAAAGPNSTKAAGGAYAQARAAFGGPQTLKDAATLGTEAFKSNGLTSEKIAAFNALSPAEQDAARIGIAEAAVDKAGQMGPNTDPVQVFLKGKNANDLIRTYLPDRESFDSFVRTLQQQSRIVKSARTVIGGSPTARIEADKAGALDDQLNAAREVWQMATGGVGSKLSGAASMLRRLTDKAGNYQRGLNEPVANELGSLLFNPNAAANRSVVQGLSGALLPRLTAQSAGQKLLQTRAGLLGPYLSAPSGAAIGANN